MNTLKSVQLKFNMDAALPCLILFNNAFKHSILHLACILIQPGSSSFQIPNVNNDYDIQPLIIEKIYNFQSSNFTSILPKWYKNLLCIYSVSKPFTLYQTSARCDSKNKNSPATLLIFYQEKLSLAFPLYYQL